jgi:hypothetical protein
MRAVPFFLVAVNAGHAEAVREAERREMYRRPDALPLPDEPEAGSNRSLAWLVSLAHRRPAARARRAAG